jgi:peptidoglycan/xylan/chitin deacetylase (PgdA/CDA1 family)
VRMTASLPLPLRKRLLTALPMTALVLTACSPATPASQESTSPPPPVIDRGVASISFDDGTIGQYTYARRVLRKHNLPGTYYLISDALGWGTATINPKQARKLLGEGNEIGNHTRDHKDLTKLTTGQMTAEFADAQDAIESQVGVRPTTCAYPNGSNNAAVLAEAENQFKACRSTQGGFNKRGRLLTYDLFSYNVHRGTTAAQVRKAAEQARTSSTWVVFVYHGVDPKLKGADDVTPKRFAAHVDAIVSTGIPVQTVESALAAMSR